MTLHNRDHNCANIVVEYGNTSQVKHAFGLGETKVYEAFNAGRKLDASLLEIGINIHKLLNLLAIIALFEMMVAIGPRVTFRAILDVARNWRLVTRDVPANYIVSPATAPGLLLLFDAHPMVAAGLSLP